MPKVSKKSFEQLNLIQRAKLEALLKQKHSLSEIAKEVNVSRQTLYREIIRNSYIIKHDVPGCYLSCVNYFECIKANKKCFRNCENYQCGILCKALKKYPFVCNYCKKRGQCRYLQRFYDTETASSKYHNKIKEAHTDTRISEETFNKIKEIVIPLLKNGQSPEAIAMNHPEFNLSESSIRFWIKNGRLPSCGSSLRLFGRRVSKTYDYSKRHDIKKLSEIKIGHKYHDYLAYINDHPNILIIQFDTVMGGLSDQKSVLTIHIVQYKFQFGILLDKHSPDEVNAKLKALLFKLKAVEINTASACYKKFASCWLADNGIEFDKLIELESINNELHVFFTKAYSSSDKGSCEKNHVMVRYIQYKGHSWDNMTQEQIDLIFSHINSYPRKSLNKKTPYDLVLDNLGQEFLDVINIKRIDKDDVTLNPSIVHKKR